MTRSLTSDYPVTNRMRQRPLEREADAEEPPPINVGFYERLASTAAGALLTGFGLFRAQHGRLPLAALGAVLVHRGVTGRCRAYRALGVDTSEPSRGRRRRDDPTVIAAQHGFKVEKSVTINRPATELYAFWRDFENLPRVMTHLRRVEVRDGGVSHWVAEGPLGRDVSWDAELFNDRPNEVLAWRSLPGSAVDTAGSVHFKELGHDRGTQVSVSLKYDPPAGRLGGWIAAMFGDDPARTIAADLRQFKRLMETGEVPAAKAQSSSNSVQDRTAATSTP